MTEASKREAITQEEMDRAAQAHGWPSYDSVHSLGRTKALAIVDNLALALARYRLATEARNPANHPDQEQIAESIIAALQCEQARLDGEDYIMDTRDCINVIREHLAGQPLPTPSTDGVVVPRARYERLLFAAGEIDSDPDLASASGKPVSVLQSAIEPAREFIPPAAPSAPVVDQREPE